MIDREQGREHTASQFVTGDTTTPFPSKSLTTRGAAIIGVTSSTRRIASLFLRQYVVRALGYQPTL